MTDTALAIDLEALALGTEALSPATCGALVEAAVLLLENAGHQSGVTLQEVAPAVFLNWGPVDPRAVASNADPQAATESGAVAVAIALVRATTPHDVVRRSRKGTGFDWHLARKGAPAPFADAWCLEVSGILDEDEGEMAYRLKNKVAQIAQGGQELPGYAVVVGFGAPSARLRAVP